MLKKDNLWIGIALGAILPLIVYTLFEVLKSQMTLYAKQSFLNILCIGANVLIFRYFIKQEQDNTAKGILLFTFIYAFVFFYFHFKA